MIATLILNDPDDVRLRAKGLYVARHASKDWFTLGKADKMTIAARLKRHATAFDDSHGAPSRHRFHPFTELAFGIALKGYDSLAIEMAEHALYTAVAAQYRFVAKSVFAAPRDADLGPLRERLFDHLLAQQRRSEQCDELRN